MWSLPFGMFAIISLPSVGGLSLLAASVLAALSIGLALLGYLLAPRGFGAAVGFSRAAIWYGLFAAYSVVSAFFLVRLFAGDFLVVPLSRDALGVPIDVRFPTLVAALAPGTSNISQTFYILLGFFFFLVLVAWCRRNGLEAAERAFRIAAVLNAVLGLLDLLALDALLDFVRTANYSLANEQGILTFQRIIGGFPEPSAFGTASATFFAYFASAWMFDRRRGNAVPALANGLCVMLSFAATGYLATGIVVIILIWRCRVLLLRPQERSDLLYALGAIGAGTAILCVSLLVTPLGGILQDLIDSLFLGKSESVSGLERATWARYGLIAFFETWGLGAGVGSIRSNGLIPVLLGSVGWPGTLFFLLFVISALGFAPAGKDRNSLIFANARLAALAQLSAAFVSGTVPDLGLIFVTVMALAAAAKQQSQRDPLFTKPEQSAENHDISGEVLQE